MKYLQIFLAFILSSYSSSAQDYKKLHSQSIVVDTHNDIITTAIEKGVSFDRDLKGKTHSDLNRLKEGGIDVQIFSIWCDGLERNPYALATKQIDTLYA